MPFGKLGCLEARASSSREFGGGLRNGMGAGMLLVHIDKERKMRRIILAGLALVAAATVFDVPTADAQFSSPRNPWCIRDGVNGPGTWDCTYHNRAQCEASQLGNGGFCTTNPNYQGGRQSTNPRRDNPRDGGTWGWGGGRW